MGLVAVRNVSPLGDLHLPALGLDVDAGAVVKVDAVLAGQPPAWRPVATTLDPDLGELAADDVDGVESPRMLLRVDGVVVDASAQDVTGFLAAGQLVEVLDLGSGLLAQTQVWAPVADAAPKTGD